MKIAKLSSNQLTLDRNQWHIKNLKLNPKAFRPLKKSPKRKNPYIDLYARKINDKLNDKKVINCNKL